MTECNMDLTAQLNVDAPFTEIFSILTQYEAMPDKNLELAYNSTDLKIVCGHINNAQELLLQGLQSLGHLVSKYPTQGKKGTEPHLGLLITGISNLAEALNYLKTDIEFILRTRLMNSKNSREC